MSLMCFTTSDEKTTKKEIDRAANQVHKFKLTLKLQKKALDSKHQIALI